MTTTTLPDGMIELLNGRWLFRTQDFLLRYRMWIEGNPDIEQITDFHHAVQHLVGEGFVIVRHDQRRPEGFANNPPSGFYWALAEGEAEAAAGGSDVSGGVETWLYEVDEGGAFIPIRRVGAMSCDLKRAEKCVDAKISALAQTLCSSPNQSAKHVLACVGSGASLKALESSD